MNLTIQRTFRGLMATCALLTLAVLGPAPAAAGTGADLSFTGCEANPNNFIIRWNVVNIDLTSPICDLHIQPGSPACPVLDARGPAGWSYVVNPDGSVDWFANTPADCIPAGATKTGFSVLVLSASLCCYDVQFTDGTGSVIFAGTKCFSCDPVSVESNTWGRVKALYR